jgi:hypothetical protein
MVIKVKCLASSEEARCGGASSCSGHNRDLRIHEGNVKRKDSNLLFSLLLADEVSQSDLPWTKALQRVIDMLISAIQWCEHTRYAWSQGRFEGSRRKRTQALGE